MEEIFAGHLAVTPQFKVVQAHRRGRTRTEEAGKQLQERGGAHDETSARETDTSTQKSEKKVAEGQRRKKDVDPRENRTVFVGNLPATVTRRKLRQLFSQHGKVANVRLRSMVVEKGKLPVRVAKRKQKQVTSSTMNAYVVYGEEEEAEKALALNGALVNERHIRVDLAGHAKEHEHQKSVFVGGLPYNADEEEVREVFAKFGDVESVRVVREAKTGQGKGFGFVTFGDRSGTMFALQHGQGLELNGQKLRVFKSKDMSQVRDQGPGARFSGLQARKAVRGGKRRVVAGSGRKRPAMGRKSGADSQSSNQVKFSRIGDKKMPRFKKKEEGGGSVRNGKKKGRAKHSSKEKPSFKKTS